MSELIPKSGSERNGAALAAPYVETAALRLQLEITDPELAAALRAHNAGVERARFALTALRIGVTALHNARGQIDADKLRHESERWFEQLGGMLAQHRDGLMRDLTEGLRAYFDPESGRFEERLSRLVQRDGELEQVLRRQVGGDDSALARTLAGLVGPESELRRALSAEHPGSLPQVLQEMTARVLRENRERLLEQFSLDRADSALSRLVRELREGHGEMSRDIRGTVDKVINEFSLDRDDSALSRLVGRVEQAQRRISNEFSLDAGDSALARMKRELEALLTRHRDESERFRNEVREALVQMNARHAESLRSTRHGGDFEAALCAAVRAQLRAGGDVVDHVGSETGVIPNCKKGDIVVTLGPEQRAQGAKIVVEAKQHGRYGATAALDEIAEARKNRAAQIGVFVFSARTAPADVEPLVRHGHDLLVVWDAEEPASDVFLQAALSIARALCSRIAAAGGARAVSPDRFDRAIRAIEKYAEGLDQFRTWAGTIVSNGEKIRSKAETMARKIARAVEELDACTRELRRAEEEGS